MTPVSRPPKERWCWSASSVSPMPTSPPRPRARATICPSREEVERDRVGVQPGGDVQRGGDAARDVECAAADVDVAGRHALDAVPVELDGDDVLHRQRLRTGRRRLGGPPEVEVDEAVLVAQVVAGDRRHLELVELELLVALLMVPSGCLVSDSLCHHPLTRIPVSFVEPLAVMCEPPAVCQSIERTSTSIGPRSSNRSRPPASWVRRPLSDALRIRTFPSGVSIAPSVSSTPRRSTWRSPALPSAALRKSTPSALTFSRAVPLRPAGRRGRVELAGDRGRAARRRGPG